MLHDVAQPPALSELGSFGSQGPALCCTIGQQRPILSPAAVDVHLSTDRRRRSTHPSSDHSSRATSGQPPRDLLPLRQRQPKLTALRALGRLPPASAMNFRSDEFCRPRCLAMRLTGTPASRMSQIVFLSSSENRTTTTPPDRRHPKPANQVRVAMTVEDTAVPGAPQCAADAMPDCVSNTTRPKHGRRVVEVPVLGPSVDRDAMPNRTSGNLRRDVAEGIVEDRADAA